MLQYSDTPLVLYALATSITPGPNNLLLLASGVRFGVRASLPHVMGIVSGFALLLVLSGMGLGALFSLLPWLPGLLKLIMAGWIVLLAWRMISADVAHPSVLQRARPETSLPKQRARQRPMRFHEAVLFQWVNPKAWMMVLGVLAVYAPPAAGLAGLLRVSGLYAAIMLPAILCWLLLGRTLQALLATPRRLRLFNLLMAALLLASVLPALLADAAFP